MLNIMLLAAPDPIRLIVIIIFAICAAAIVFWFLRKVTIPEPLNYVVYAAIALVALLCLYWLYKQFAGV
jgi:hypothetical protein